MEWTYTRITDDAYAIFCNGRLEASAIQECVADFIVKAFQMNEQFKQNNPSWGTIQ